MAPLHACPARPPGHYSVCKSLTSSLTQYTVRAGLAPGALEAEVDCAASGCSSADEKQAEYIATPSQRCVTALVTE
jgi:hypothetical protein